VKFRIVFITFFFILFAPEVYSYGLTVTNQDLTVHSMSEFLVSGNGLRVDVNQDGDVQDQNDYVVYNEIYITDTYGGVTFHPVFTIEPTGFTPTFNDFLYSEIKIRGEDYFVTDIWENGISLGKAIKKRLHTQPYSILESAIAITNSSKLNLDENFYLYIIGDSGVEGSIKISVGDKQKEITQEIHEVSDAFDEYRIFITDIGAGELEIQIVKPQDIQTITDEQENVFGYEKVFIDSTKTPQGENKIRFMGKPIELNYQNNKVKFDDPDYYYFNYDHYQKKLWITIGYIPKLTEEPAVEKEWRGYDLTNKWRKMINLTEFDIPSKYIKVDGNNDGDLDDKEDYVLYNQLYVFDISSYYTLVLVYSLEQPYTIIPRITDFKGKNITIKGKDYIVTDVKDYKITIDANDNTSAPITLRDMEEGSFGYEDLRINNEDIPLGRGKIIFMSKKYKIKKRMDSVPIEDVPYYSFETNSYGELRIKQNEIPKPVEESVQTEGVIVQEVAEEIAKSTPVKEEEITESVHETVDVSGKEESITQPEAHTREDTQAPPTHGKGICGPTLLCILVTSSLLAKRYMSMI